MGDPELRVNEEVARFAFEVYIQHFLGSEVYVAFANPTAGPWKTVKLLSEAGQLVEVHRFGIHDQRPDLVLVDPASRTMLVVEAKGGVGDLLTRDQVVKAREAYTAFQRVVAARGHELLRVGFETVPGFLWACEAFDAEVELCLRAVSRHWLEVGVGAVLIGIDNLDAEAHVHLAYRGSRPQPAIVEKMGNSSRATVHA